MGHGISYRAFYIAVKEYVEIIKSYEKDKNKTDIDNR